MSGLFLFGRRTLEPRSTDGIFEIDPVVEPNGNGRYNFDNWDDEFPRDAFDLALRVWWQTNEPSSVLMQFVDPIVEEGVLIAARNRMIVIEESDLTSFVEDNLGQWWIVPRRAIRNQPQELWVTTDTAGEQMLNVEIAWLPRWPCTFEDLQRRLQLPHLPTTPHELPDSAVLEREIRTLQARVRDLERG